MKIPPINAFRDSTFSLPEVDYDFIPGWGTIGRLLDMVGRAMTTEFLFIGDKEDGRS